MKIRSIVWLLPLTCAALPVAAEEHTQHAAHVHGEARLDLVLEGRTLSADLESPAGNLVGFEHPPETAAERERLAQTRATLEQEGVRLLGLPAAARCVQVSAEVHSTLLEADEAEHEHAHGDTGHDAEGGHADFDVAWAFQCEEPATLKRLSLGLFAAFPGIGGLHVQTIGPAGQKGTEASAAQPVVEL